MEPESFGTARAHLITQDIGEIVEPDWDILIPDQLQFQHPLLHGIDIVKRKPNIDLREMAHSQWTAIIGELRERETLAPAALELTKRLVIARIRCDVASSVLFEEGFQLYDIDIRRTRRSYAGDEISTATRLATYLEDKLGLSPQYRHKVGKVQIKRVATRGSAEFLGGNVEPIRRW